ncbi:MAG TPA: DUF5666 domain-containing protein [Blastocatellia bacterium]|jgi:hypothetical protein|nr:DUF5666 domain-containing protein [Blastocatellia bacterium]
MRSRCLGIVAVFILASGIFPAGGAFASGGENEVKFTGFIESLPPSGLTGNWVVSGTTVRVGSGTRVEQEDGRASIGAVVKVEGRRRSDGSVDATEVEVKEAGPGGGGNGGGNDDNGRGEAEFKGTLESFPQGFIGDWRIGGRIVRVTAATRIETEDGPVAVGAFVEVKGVMRPDGSMNATKIEIKSNVAGGDGRDELKGTIEALPDASNFVGDWRVSGRTVRVTSATIIDQEHGVVAVGSFVEVKGTMRADWSIDATKVEVKTGVDGREGENVNFKGNIEALPTGSDFIGDWMISGRRVHVLSSTRLKAEHGAFRVGTRVKVKGVQLAGGAVVATRIQVKD